MKKTVLFILIIISLLSFSLCTHAAGNYISIERYPFSSHVLGEDLIICGETDFSHVSVALYYPDDRGYGGELKFAIILTKNEFKDGYAIKTEPSNRLWPEGLWTLKVQNGQIYDEITVKMTSQPDFSQKIFVAEYTYNTLTSLSSYSTRGVLKNNNVVCFKAEDGTEIKVFSWDCLKPADCGDCRIYIAFYNFGMLTDIKSYQGSLADGSNCILLNMPGGKSIKIFCWDDDMSPLF